MMGDEPHRRHLAAAHLFPAKVPHRFFVDFQSCHFSFLHVGSQKCIMYPFKQFKLVRHWLVACMILSRRQFLFSPIQVPVRIRLLA